ncbi:MAG: pseudouridine synthase [Planctomycetota bacterium]
MPTERIQKLLANAGLASRRAIEAMVLEGRVRHNGTVVRELPVMVDPETDTVEVDGESVKLGGTKRRRVYVLMNKPAGYVCTNRGQQTALGPQRLAIDLLPPGFRKRVYPVGRLDAESTGLLLLTDDGPITQKLTHPGFGVPKVYRVVCAGQVDNAVLRELEQGVRLADRDGKTYVAKVSSAKMHRRGRDRSIVDLTLKGGRNRQIRRALAKFDHKVRKLQRIRFGPLTLDKLKPGESRLLTPAEVKALRRSVGVEK